MGSVKGEVQRGQAEQPEIDAMLEAKSWFARYGSSKATGLSILL